MEVRRRLQPSPPHFWRCYGIVFRASAAHFHTSNTMPTDCCRIWRRAWKSAFSAPCALLAPPCGGARCAPPQGATPVSRFSRPAGDGSRWPMPPKCRIFRHLGFDAPTVAGAPWICSAWGSSHCAVERSPANGAPPHGAKPPPHAPQAPLALAECNPLVPWAPTPLPLEASVIPRRLARRATGGRRGENGCYTGGIAGRAAWKDIVKLLYCGNRTGA